MNADAEKRAAESAERHATEFRRKHKVSREEWNRAEAMTADLVSGLLAAFWRIYENEKRS